MSSGIFMGATFAAAVAGSSFDIDWHTLDGGGGTSTDGTYTMSVTIGQPDPGVMTGGGWTLEGGFWIGGARVAPCLGDLNGDGFVDTVDFLQLLAGWGPNPGHPADLNADGTVDTVDFLELLANWGPCP